MRRRLVGLPGLVALALAPAAPAAAQSQPVGATAIVRNQVSGSLPARSLDVGSGVFRNEQVRTGLDSQAKLVFLDDTNISIGPQSAVTLDRFVYAGDSSAQTVSVNFARGAFRFATGNSEKKAYQLRTPIATIGVRGTVLDIRSQQGRTTVVLVEGEASVCATSGRGGGGARPCRQLLTPGDTAVVTTSGVSGGQRGSAGASWSFAATCNATAGLCGRTLYAALAPTEFSALLCGR